MEEYVGQEKGVETVGEDEGVQAEGASNAGPGGGGGARSHSTVLLF